MTEFHLDISSIPFNLDYTLNCGQVFRWEKKSDWWHGVIGHRVAKVKQAGDTLITRTVGKRDIAFVKNFFRLDDDLPHILSSIGKDLVINEAIQRFYGLRIIRQNPLECLISYICATNTSISSVQAMLSNVCRKFGERIEFEGNVYFTFPTLTNLARAKVAELEACGLGYRSTFVVVSTHRILTDKIPLDELRIYEYSKAKEKLLAKSWGRKLLTGVGPKVADCALLFSMDKLEAFPIDIWIQKAILEFYLRLFKKSLIERLRANMLGDKSLGASDYENIARKMREYFGGYAGYAQEYLYAYMRSLNRT